MRVVLTGGALGGHLIPFEPIVDALRGLYQEQRESLPAWIENNKLEIYFLGVLPIEALPFFKRLGITAKHIPAGKLRRYPSAQTLPDMLLRLPFGSVLALFQMWRIMPDVVISKGGYGSIPVAAAAVIYRIPFLLHESDAVSGLANRILARWASVITVGFAATRKTIGGYGEKTIVTGTPVRSSLSAISREAAKRTFGYSAEQPVLTVVGGSQGAMQLNDILVQTLPTLLAFVNIIHIVGAEHLDKVTQAAKEVLGVTELPPAYKPFGYLTEQMPAALAAADAVVTRAGATSLAELAALKKASIVVPLDAAAQDHQRRNAEVFVAAAAARIIDPANLGRSIFIQNVRDLIGNPGIRETLENNIQQLARPQAARDIALLSIKLAQGLVPRQPNGTAKPAPASGQCR